MSTVTRARRRKAPEAPPRRAGVPDPQRPLDRFSSAMPPLNAADLSDQIIQLPLGAITPHPQNPGRGRITEENIHALASDIAEHGQQQPIKVRPAAGGGYQIIFGERRYRAMAALGRATIGACVEVADDARTLTLMAIENAQRVDLDAIAVAEHLQELTRQGLTQEEAGRCYGVSQGEVANRIRLLRLPEGWRALVTSGEIPAKQARALVAYADAPQLLDALLASYRQHQWFREQWQSDAACGELDELIAREMLELTRPIQPGATHYHGYPIGAHPRLFELTDALSEKLGVVSLPVGKRAKKGARRETEERAINCKLWDKLNLPLAKAKSEAARSGKSKPKQAQAGKRPAKELSKSERAQLEAQQRRAREQRKGQLREACDAWRLRMLRLTTSQELKAGDWRTNVAAAYCFVTWDHDSNAYQLLLNIAAHELSASKLSVVDDRTWGRTAPLLAKLVTACQDDGDEIAAAERILATICRVTLWPTSPIDLERGKPHAWIGSGDPAWQDRLPQMNGAAVEQLAELWHVTLEDGWRAGATLRTAQRQLITQLLTLHRRSELVDLAAELGVELSATSKHGEAVQAILAAHTHDKPLKVPSCLQPKRRSK